MKCNLIAFISGSRLTSPRPSVIGKSSRKRALSRSPFSEYGLDIEGLTRSSEGSLILPFGQISRSSSASGSYGHLSAGLYCMGSHIFWEKVLIETESQGWPFSIPIPEAFYLFILFKMSEYNVYLPITQQFGWMFCFSSFSPSTVFLCLHPRLMSV